MRAVFFCKVAELPRRLELWEKVLQEGLPGASKLLEEALAGDVAPTFAQATCREAGGAMETVMSMRLPRTLGPGQCVASTSQQSLFQAPYTPAPRTSGQDPPDGQMRGRDSEPSGQEGVQAKQRQDAKTLPDTNQINQRVGSLRSLSGTYFPKWGYP